MNKSRIKYFMVTYQSWKLNSLWVQFQCTVLTSYNQLSTSPQISRMAEGTR